MSEELPMVPTRQKLAIEGRSRKGAITGKLTFLITNAKQDIIELQAKLEQIIAHHPTGGGDAANLASLNAVLAQLT
jgi:hypothetical protein